MLAKGVIFTWPPQSASANTEVLTGDDNRETETETETERQRRERDERGWERRERVERGGQRE